jgi:hypothetical protein
MLSIRTGRPVGHGLLWRACLWLGAGWLAGSAWLAGAMAVAAELEFPGLGERGQLVALEFEPAGGTMLRGKNARMQLIVTGVYTSGQRHDLTHDVRYTVSDPAVLEVQEGGFVIPLRDGEALVTATEPGGKTVARSLQAESCGQQLPVSFANEVVPIFTRLGCNAGGCHGKADGQNGFKLSLLGFYPEDDYEFLVHESRGRRVFPGDPDFSLLLLKPANILPHGGGARMNPGTYEWELVAEWIRQGLPEGSADDPQLEKIEVVPPVSRMNFKQRQQLSVVGYYSDGTTRDVTRLASFESNQPDMAFVDTEGRVGVRSTPGEAAVMVRFQGQVSVFRAVIPQGLPVPTTPPEKTWIDQLVFRRLKELGIPPAELCDDATFIRRATLDITGRLPSLEETQEFLASGDGNKRERLIDRLVDSPGYADCFANKWSTVLRNKRRNGNDIPYTYRFHAWIRQALDTNLPYDQFVRGVLTAAGDAENYPPVAWYREVATSSEQMEDTAQLFLGMRLGCAKCHHHPFERWSQQDYYGFEAFFSQVGLKVSRFNPQAGLPDMVFLKGNAPEMVNPRTKLPVKPTGLGGAPLDIPAWEDARQVLVDWMAAPENPFFAKALVNRYWKHFLGRGIVDPEDDLRVTNPPSNPELLDALARHFVEHRYDMKDLVRTICKSSVYQLSAEPTPANARDSQNYSRFYPRRMSAEVLFDAINHVAGVPANFGGVPEGTTSLQLPDNGFNNYFLQVFGKPEAESVCECERSVEANLAQSLHLLNSTDMQGRLQNGNGIAGTLAQEQERPLEDKVREVYLRAFSRPPQAEEQQAIADYIAAAANPRQAWEDVLWALFNAKEFQFVR